MSNNPDVGSRAERSAQGVVELIVPELDNTLTFYRSLGFAVERWTTDFVALAGYGCRLFLARDPAVAVPPVRGCNLRIIVNDVDDVYRRVVGAGIAAAREPANRGYGLRDFSVIDPNGFGLRFAQLLDA